MKASKWVEFFQRIPPNEEVHVDGVIRERDLAVEAELLGKTLTTPDAQFIIQKMGNRNDNTNTLIESYLEMFLKGELDNET